MCKIFMAAMAILFTVCLGTSGAHAELRHIKESSVLRHIGVLYSNFVTGDGDGLDTEILKLYATEIGVRYEHVPSSWETVISDLSGKKIIPHGNDVEVVGETTVKGDIVGNGLTILPWREKVISFSDPYFPTAIWAIAAADSNLHPISPSGVPKDDIAATKSLLTGRHILGIRDTCLDPALYNIDGVVPVYKEGLQLNDLPAAVAKGECELTLQDAPDALFALASYPGKVKVLGAITEEQFMAFGISRDSPDLLESFNNFLRRLKDSGKLLELIIKYYPLVTTYFPNAGK